jgi:hypothetical protein
MKSICCYSNVKWINHEICCLEPFIDLLILFELLNMFAYTGIVGSSSTRGMDVCGYSVFVLCVKRFIISESVAVEEEHVKIKICLCFIKHI